jgi:molybdopterin-guanine dinucleotide biosynthesis protein A
MAERGLAGVVLAGGLSRRMGGGDKTLRMLAGRPMLAHVIERLRPQVDAMLLNANGDVARFAGFGLPVMPDAVAGYAGPLAGILTGMLWARAHAQDCRFLLSVAADAPFLPIDLGARLLAGARSAGARLACAWSAGQAHPVFGLWDTGLADDLRRAVEIEGVRKVDVWTARHALVTVDFAVAGVDPFFNANRPEDLEAAERMLAHGSVNTR